MVHTCTYMVVMYMEREEIVNCREVVFQQRCFMCGGVHYWEAEGLVSVERWSCSRGASCVVEYTIGRLRDWSL